MRRMFSEKQIKELTKNYIESENLNVNGKITGNEIVENMSGYTFAIQSIEGLTLEPVYAGVVKNGNKLTVVIALNITKTGTVTDNKQLAVMGIPSSVGERLYTTNVGGFNFLDNKVIPAFLSYNSVQNLYSYIQKQSNTSLGFVAVNFSNLTANEKYYWRYEATFLLSDNLAS